MRCEGNIPPQRAVVAGGKIFSVSAGIYCEGMRTKQGGEGAETSCWN